MSPAYEAVEVLTVLLSRQEQLKKEEQVYGKLHFSNGSGNNGVKRCCL